MPDVFPKVVRGYHAYYSGTAEQASDACRYYDVSIGNGPIAKQGLRVAVHYDARWRGVTFMTSR